MKGDDVIKEIRKNQTRNTGVLAWDVADNVLDYAKMLGTLVLFWDGIVTTEQLFRGAKRVDRIVVIVRVQQHHGGGGRDVMTNVGRTSAQCRDVQFIIDRTNKDDFDYSAPPPPVLPNVHVFLTFFDATCVWTGGSKRFDHPVPDRVIQAFADRLLLQQRCSKYRKRAAVELDGLVTNYSPIRSYDVGDDGYLYVRGTVSAVEQLQDRFGGTGDYSSKGVRFALSELSNVARAVLELNFESLLEHSRVALEYESIVCSDTGRLLIPLFDKSVVYSDAPTTPSDMARELGIDESRVAVGVTHALSFLQSQNLTVRVLSSRASMHAFFEPVSGNDNLLVCDTNVHDLTHLLEENLPLVRDTKIIFSLGEYNHPGKVFFNIMNLYPSHPTLTGICVYVGSKSSKITDKLSSESGIPMVKLVEEEDDDGPANVVTRNISSFRRIS